MCLILAGTLDTAKAQPTISDRPPGVVVTFGTSLTARGGWQVPLAERLSACLDRGVAVRTVARSGAPSAWGLAHVDDVVGLKPDVVIIEFYANDAALNRFTSLRSSRETIAQILLQLHDALPRARLIMQVMNPFSGLRGAIRPFLDAYINAHIEEAARHHTEIVDHRPAWAAMPDADRAYAIPDGSHPRPEAAIAIVVPALAATIAGPRC